jgi:MoaA/NifB/PqqE/SkfB family radical SAM enzyme
MLTGVHFLLTYTCNYECDHCFLYCSPQASGTFTLAQLREVLDEAGRIGTVTSVYFEGGEPFLYFPLLVKGLRLARECGFSTGVVSNCYWATAVEDAGLWLEPVRDAGIDDLSLSDDEFHNPDGGDGPAQRAAAAAERLGISAGSICIEAPLVQAPSDDRGAPVVGGGALFKGRAAEKLTDGLPRRPPSGFTECKHEELVAPQRVHVDSFGNVHVCQGVSIGNMWTTPLSSLIGGYNAAEHPICGPLVQGGPRALAEEYGVNLDGEFVDECHYCYLVRRSLIERFPEHLAPRQVYGLA